MKKSKLLLLGSAVLAMTLAVTPVIAATAKKVVKPVKSAVVVAPTKVGFKFIKADFVSATLVNKTINGYKVASQYLIPVKDAVDFNGDTYTYNAKAKTVTITHRQTPKTMAVAKVINNAPYVDVNVYGKAMNMTFDATTKEVKNNTARVQPMWASSKHNSANFIPEITTRETTTAVLPFENTGSSRCINCHNGLAFGNDTATASSIELSKVSIDCVACHAKGGALINAGQVTLADFQAGTGGATYTKVGPSALCISCHVGRGKSAVNIAADGTVTASKKAPHGSVQVDVLYGFGGYAYGKALPTSPHAANPEACIGCHMAPTKEGVLSHAFKITDENVPNACGLCHKGLESLERRALADYDGNKQFGSIQDEVQGLQTELNTAILNEAKKVNANVASFTSSHGSVSFIDANGAAVTVPDKFYIAAFNLFITENDGSKGIHNPAYVVSLLQNTYKDVTGVNVPGATLR